MSGAATAPAVADGYARLRPGGGGAAVRGRGAVIWVEGPDAVRFLHGLLSNDVAGLAPGAAARALLLDARGHVLAEVAVRRDDDEALTLLAEPAAAGAVAEILERYHFSEDLELIGPEEVGLVTAPEGAAGAGEAAFPGLLPGTVDLVVDDPAAALAATGLPEAPAEALELARVAAGLARVGVDTGPSTLVQEAALEGRAVSFEKGCYLGQETVARAQFRGRVNRLLRGLELPSPPPAAGSPVLRAGREVGTLTSVAATPDLGPVGLAILRREAEPGESVEVAGAPARVVELPFAAR